jgi:diadenosine tetraphosphate (Ap4A) HIT family hydrolase
MVTTTEMAGESCPTYQDICTFCDEVSGAEKRFYDLGLAETPDDYQLLQTDDFVVVPCIGALTDWYVLIVPRRHVLSSGWLSDDERTELRKLVDRVTAKLIERTGHEVVTFEHGSYSFRDKGGSCHDHSHVHVVATERPVSDFIDHVGESVELRPCADWIDEAGRIIAESNRSYLALESSAGSMIAIAQNAPSAFFRKSLVRWLGAEPGEDDWLVYPQVERLRTMVAAGL